MGGDSFDGIPDRLRAGDEAAAQEVCNRFTARLITLARGRLDKMVRVKVDADDVVQSVYRSFFLRQQAADFELNDWEGLWALLARITVRKCGRHARAQRAARRDVRREVCTPGTDDDDKPMQWEAPQREPTPEEAATFQETLSNLFSELPEEKHQMLVMRLQGYTVEEISRETQRTERSVYRLMNLVRSRLLETERDV